MDVLRARCQAKRNPGNSERSAFRIACAVRVSAAGEAASIGEGGNQSDESGCRSKESDFHFSRAMQCRAKGPFFHDVWHVEKNKSRPFKYKMTLRVLTKRHCHQRARHLVPRQPLHL
jgi:hypothetical protein